MQTFKELIVYGYLGKRRIPLPACGYIMQYAANLVESSFRVMMMMKNHLNIL